jgi:hypothetical protein
MGVNYPHLKEGVFFRKEIKRERKKNGKLQINEGGML